MAREAETYQYKQVELLPTRAHSNAFPRCPITRGAAAITI